MNMPPFIPAITRYDGGVREILLPIIMFKDESNDDHVRHLSWIRRCELERDDNIEPNASPAMPPSYV